MQTPDDTTPALYRLGTKLYRIIQLCVVCVLIVAFMYGWQWLSDPTKFPIRSIKIQSAYKHVDQQTLKSEIMPYTSQGFIRLHAVALKKDLLKLPWISAVTIERIWPDTIVINIAEQEAVGRFGQTDLLNDKGEIFTPPVDTIPTDLPLLNGPSDQAVSLWTSYQTITETLKPLGLSVHELDMDDRLSLKIVLNNGMGILLGKTDPLPRLQRFVKVYHDIFTSDKMQANYVDLRYENGTAISWRSGNQTIVPQKSKSETP